MRLDVAVDDATCVYMLYSRILNKCNVLAEYLRNIVLKELTKKPSKPPKNGPFGLRSGQFRTKIFGATNSKLQKFSICAAVATAAGVLSCGPKPRRPEGPRRGGDGLTN